MSSCCDDKSCAVDRLASGQSHVLWIVLFINLAMFGVELAAGLLSRSVALLSDSADMLGDAWVYAFSIFVIGRGLRWKIRAAAAKAVVMGMFGVFVLGQIVFRLIRPEMPSSETMGVVALLALLANGVCFGLLWRHRGDDINMQSVWLCSRNDLIANSSVLVAAGAVRWTGSSWPDLLVGALICAVFLQSAYSVSRAARAQWQQVGLDSIRSGRSGSRMAGP